MPDGPWSKYQSSEAVAPGPWAKYGQQQAQPAAEQSSTMGALWDGLVHGAGNIAYGAARIGSRMQEPTAFSEPNETLAPRVDAAAQDRTRAFQASPGVKSHPWASGAGEIGGEMVATAPLALGAGGSTLAMRALWGALMGGAGGALGGANTARPEQFGQDVGRSAGVGAAIGAPIAGGAALIDPVIQRELGTLLRDTRGSLGGEGPIGGGRVEPLPKELPVIPPGLQPPRPVGPNILPPRPGTPAIPGGSVVPQQPVPVIPPGMQPPRPSGPGVPPMRPGVPPVPGGAVGPPPPPPGPYQTGGLQPPRPAGPGVPPSRPGTPAPPGGRVEPSPLAEAIAKNSASDIDSAITRKFRQIIKPSKADQGNAPALAEQDRRILTTVDQIIANRANLQLTDASGNAVRGQLPRSLRQFAEAIDQTKKGLFQQYDALAQRAGGFGVQVDLAPVIRELRAIAQKPEVIDLHPGLIPEAEQLARNFEARGFYTPSAAQDTIENLNRTLAAFYKNPTHETVSRATILAPIARTLRQQLDAAIEAGTGPGYQALRLQYGALQSIEKGVAGAVQREANKIPGGLSGTFADIAASEEALRGIFTLSPAALLRSGGIKAAQSAVRYINNPNRAIQQLFNRRLASMSPPAPWRQNMASGLGSLSGPTGAVAGSQQPAARNRMFEVTPPPGTH